MNYALDREYWIERTLKKIPANSKILDAGAGELGKKKYCSHLRYVSQDFAQYDGQGDGHGLQTDTWDQTKLDIISDITAIPVESASFDAVMCIEVFEHLPDPLAALQEFSRIVHSGGYLILTAPFCSLTHFAPYHFITGFNRYWYEKHLPTYDFEIIELTSNGNFLSYLHQELNRIPYIVEKYNLSKLSLFEKIAKKIINRYLLKNIEKAHQTNELLCFGYQIFAKRK
ncbi:class I SAM-dependent methyltransferase [Desulfovibrio piger]|uniref:class I SAM-dependent methyltransferase n=1 Tax=Desulfovibrio piger TaxID=901 RepID=UPI00093130E6|nr:class I SAM-dependent methyltransferase [Desulfovibrio piger]